MLMNHRNPVFADGRVRRALTVGLDRHALHRALDLPDSLPLTDGVYSVRQFRERRLPDPLVYSLEAASSLLADAGWHHESSAGVRERNGRQFRFTLIVPHEGMSLARSAIVLQNQLSRLGVQMEVQLLENLVVRERLNAGDFDAALHWTGSSPLAHIGFLGKHSATGYANTVVEQLLQRAASSVDLDEQDRIFRELSQIARIDLPVTFLFPEVTSWAVRRRIRGLESPVRANPIFHMEDLWLQDESLER